MEIRFQIDDEFIEKLKKDLKGVKTNQMTEDALTLLNWVVSETKQGRLIVSTNAQGEVIKELAMPTLEKIKVK